MQAAFFIGARGSSYCSSGAWEVAAGPGEEGAVMNTVESIQDIEMVNNILEYLKVRSKRNHLLFSVGIYTGLRISDILPLRVRDVKGREWISLRMEKTDVEMKVPINEELRLIIDAYIEGMHDYECLFQSRKGVNKPISSTQAYNIIREAAEAFGLRNVGCHSMRKTFGWLMYSMTKDIMLVRDSLGQSDISITRRYIGINKALKDQAIRNLSFKKRVKK